jgi:hypothetical protein
MSFPIKLAGKFHQFPPHWQPVLPSGVLAFHQLHFIPLYRITRYRGFSDAGPKRITLPILFGFI